MGLVTPLSCYALSTLEFAFDAYHTHDLELN